MSQAANFLNEQYILSLSQFGEPDTTVSSMFESGAQVFGVILDSIRSFLDGTAMLIIRLVDYAKQIITTPKFPKKIKKARNAITDIAGSITNILLIPSEILSLGQHILTPFQPLIEVLGSISVNLYDLAGSAVDAVFFGDLAFKPLLRSIQFGSGSGTNTGALAVINPFMNFLIATLLSPFTFVKSLLELLRPVWNFIKSLASASPMRFLRAIGKLPSMLSKVIEFLRGIVNAFTSNFPIGIFELVEPIASALLQPMLSVSQGLRSLGIGQLFSSFINLITDFISGQDVTARISTLVSSNATYGILVWFFVFIKDTLIGAVNYLFGPILNLLGISLNMSSQLSVAASQNSEPQLTGNEFTAHELNLVEFNRRWELHNAWTSNLGLYTREEREDILELNGGIFSIDPPSDEELYLRYGFVSA